jgi:hypothetical protein
MTVYEARAALKHTARRSPFCVHCGHSHDLAAATLMSPSAAAASAHFKSASPRPSARSSAAAPASAASASSDSSAHSKSASPRPSGRSSAAAPASSAPSAARSLRFRIRNGEATLEQSLEAKSVMTLAYSALVPFLQEVRPKDFFVRVEIMNGSTARAVEEKPWSSCLIS